MSKLISKIKSAVLVAVLGFMVVGVTTQVFADNEPDIKKVMLGIMAQRYPWNGILDIQYKTPYADASHTVTFMANGIVIGTAEGTGGEVKMVSFDLNVVADGAFKNMQIKNFKITATIK